MLDREVVASQRDKGDEDGVWLVTSHEVCLMGYGHCVTLHCSRSYRAHEITQA